MDILDKQIHEFLRDRSSGSMTLASHAINIVKRLYSSKSTEQRIQDFLHKAVERFPQMVVIKKLHDHFLQHSVSDESICAFENLLADNSYIAKAGFLFDTMKKVITFSRSNSVEQVLVHYKEKIERVICCHSLPLGEGKKIAESLKTGGMDTQLIEDAELSKYMIDHDMLLVGADAITESYFVNKVGTLQAILVANYFKKPVYVISSRMKEMSEQAYVAIDPGRYFEKIDKQLITEVIY